jgi:hypothetical protein
MYSLPTLSYLCLKLKKIMKRLPMRSLTYWGILAIETANKNERIVQKRAFTYKDRHKILPLPHMGMVHISTGATPLFPSVYNMEVVLPVEVEVPSIGVLPKSKLD